MKHLVLFLALVVCVIQFTHGQVANKTVSRNAATRSNGYYYQCPPCNLPCDTIHFDKPGICHICGMKLFASLPGFENKVGRHAEEVNKKVGVLLFPGVEIIDYAGPWEVFAAAGMEVFSIGKTSAEINSMNLKIRPDYTFENSPIPDILLIPGGNVNSSDTTTTNWIKKINKLSSHTMSVCTGAFYLGAAGLLDSLTVTTNYPAVQRLQSRVPSAKVLDNVRFVDNGKIITSAGLSSGIDAAFHLVSKYIGIGQTKRLANVLEYKWDEKNPFVRGKLAEKYVDEILSVLSPFDYDLEKYEGDENYWIIQGKIKSPITSVQLIDLISMQIEESLGWTKAKNNRNAWTFSADNKSWIANLSLKTEPSTRYHLALFKVSKL